MTHEGRDDRTTPAMPRNRPATVHVRRRHRAQLLLVVPFVALLAVPVYAREEPSLLGWPFFYWYQFAWGLITIALMAFVYRVTRIVPGDGAAEPLQDREREG